MPGGHFVVLLLLLWQFAGRGIGGEQNVKKLLHSQAVLNPCHGHEQNVSTVEWARYRNSIKTLVFYITEKPLNVTCWTRCPNMHIQNKSLILTNLTEEDEAVYEERTVFVNGSVKHCNISLSVLSPPTALRIAVSVSRCPLTLRCEVRGEVLNLRWLRDGQPLTADNRISFNESNRIMQVSCLNISDWGRYTCQASNANISSEVHVNITGEITIQGVQNRNTVQILYFAGGTLTAILILCIILMCICKHGCCRTDPSKRKRGRRRTDGISMEEPVYDEPMLCQDEPVTPVVDPLPYVYSSFIKPKTQPANKEQSSEDFGYSTIEEVRTNAQALQTTATASN